MMMIMMKRTEKKGGQRQHLLSSKCSCMLALVSGLALAQVCLAGQTPGAFSAAAANAFGAHGSGATAAASSTATAGKASAMASAGLLPRFPRQTAEQKRQAQLRQEIKTTLDKLNALESKESESIEECAEWYNLNERLKQLTGGKQAQRQGEINKKDECDHLDKLIGDMRSKLEAFHDLVKAENNHLEFVGGLVNNYLELKKLAHENPLLAKELENKEQSEPQVGLGTERIGQFIEYMDDILANNRHPGDDEPNVMSSGHGGPVDDIRDIEKDLREIIDRENDMSEEDVEKLSDSTGRLDKLLGEGHLDYNSGTYHYVAGTLDAARAVVMHTMAKREAEPEPEPEPLPLPLPIFTKPTPSAPPAQAVAFASANGPAHHEHLPMPSPFWSYPKQGNHAAGYATAGNGAATAASEANSNGHNGYANAASSAQANGNGSQATSLASSNHHGQAAFAGSQASGGGSASSAAAVANH